MKAHYKIPLDQALVKDIEQVISLEKEQLNTDPDSQKWYALQGEIADRLQDIAWQIIYEYKELPF